MGRMKEIATSYRASKEYLWHERMMELQSEYAKSLKPAEKPKPIKIRHIHKPVHFMTYFEKEEYFLQLK